MAGSVTNPNTQYKHVLVLIKLILYITHLGNSQNIRKDLKSHPNWHLVDRDDDCGQSVADRIIGGDEASLGQYPWIARLGYSYELEPESPTVDIYECGGAIINNKYILTAAHCSPESVGIKLLKIRLGEHNVRTDPDCIDGICAPPVQDIDVDEYYCHPDYHMKTYKNDICLVRLATPIIFNEYVQPICLPSYDTLKNNPFSKEIMEVAGWGVTDIETLNSSDSLMTLKVPIINNELCKLAYSGKADIINKQMCAGGVIGKDSCSGDSGGPLMKPFSMQAPPRYFIIGIVSFGPKKCASTNTAGVYTIVSKYMKWILDNIKE